MSAVRFKFRCNILISGKIIKEMPGSLASGTLYIRYEKDLNCAAVKITTVQVTNLPLPQTLSKVRFDLLNGLD